MGPRSVEGELLEYMTFKRKGKLRKPLNVFEVNQAFLVGVYQGSFSKYDILIKYRQWNGKDWSRLRTPKHIHWAVDILIKMHADERLTKNFLGYLISIWNETKPFKTKAGRAKFLKPTKLTLITKKDFAHFERLSRSGEYSIRFLILLARLLMVQEKTNLENAFMFKKLLDALKKGNDIFSIVSIASHTG